MIFEEHAKLEWKAPAIDGRVCRLWREIVLNTPRAWAYLEISSQRPPTTSNLLSWLDRSCATPLHISVDTLEGHRTLSDLLRDSHTRIASLRMIMGNLSLFEGRDFPCLRLLDIKCWYLEHQSFSPFQWGAMPKLQSLRLPLTNSVATLLNSVAALKTLALHSNRCFLPSRHSRSLVTLMLHSVSLGDAISGSVDFPSLTYLSLYHVSGLKPRINAPRLATYHESRSTVHDSFSAPVPSLLEYGVCDLHTYHPDPLEWHRAFPNILRLSIRANPPILISIFDSLAVQLHLLPALRMISAGTPKIRLTILEEQDQKMMDSLVRARSEACQLDLVLHFEMGRASHIPLFFGDVRYCPSDDL